MKELLSIAITVGLILAISLFLNVLDKKDHAETPQSASSERQPDVTITNISMIRTDDFGFHKFYLQAEQVQHYLKVSSEIRNLRLLVNSPDESDWMITAESGWFDADSRQLLLQGEVLVHQELADKSTITSFTRDMIIDYANSLAYTTSTATLLNDGNMTRGTGLAIRFSTPSRIELLSRVTGVHVFE